jgi:hypothetical protein
VVRLYKKTKKLAIDITPELHYELKMQALQEKTTIKSLVLDMIEKCRKDMVK